MHYLPKSELIALINNIENLEQMEYVSQALNREQKFYDARDLHEFKNLILIKSIDIQLSSRTN